MIHASPARLCVAMALCLCGVSPATARGDALEQATQARARGEWLAALAIYERLQADSPDDAELYRLRTLTLADVGSASRAWALLQARPGLFTADEAARMEADHVARLAVWGGARPLDEPRRLEDMRRAEAAALAVQAADTPRHAFDRLVILNGLEQHAQAAGLYRRLRAEGITVPAYALAAAGDSLLAARHPEEAVEALEGAAEALHDDVDTQVVLAYAYLESGRHADATRHLARIVRAEPAWQREPGARTADANWNRYSAETNLAMVLAYSGHPGRAEAMLAPMAAMAPASSDLNAKLGAVVLQRGRPEEALQRFDVAHTQDPRNLDARIGRVDALAELGRMRRARRAHDALMQAWPDNVHARRLHEQWRHRTGWQVEASLHGGRGDADGPATASPLGSRDGGHALAVRSPLLGDRWRLGAFRSEQWAEFDDATPRVRDLRHGIGLHFRHDRLEWEVQAARSDDRRTGPLANDATAYRAAAGWRFNDQWRARAEAGHNDADASLQARAAGILADTAALGLQWTRDERAGLGGEFRQWRYDDGNRRESLSVDGYNAVLAMPRLRFELRGQVHVGRGSRDDAPYFNPTRDAGWTLGADLRTTHWQRYDHAFSQQFGVALGQSWQDGFSAQWVPSLGYRHAWSLGYGRSLDYGVNWSRPVYDGQRERHLSFDVQLHWGQ